MPIDGNPATIDLAVKLTGIHNLTAADCVGVAGNNALPSAQATKGQQQENPNDAQTYHRPGQQILPADQSLRTQEPPTARRLRARTEGAARLRPENPDTWKEPI